MEGPSRSATCFEKSSLRVRNNGIRMKPPKFQSVEEYLAAQDPAKARTLRSVIDLILTQFAELESKIS